MSFTKDLVKRTFLAAGVEIKRVGPQPGPPPVYKDVWDVCRRTNSGERACYLCPISKCVVLSGFSFSRNSWHPFVEATREHVQSGFTCGYDGSSLELYYRSWMPENALEALIGAATGPAMLAQYPAYAMHSPWLDITPEERRSVMEKIIREENRCAGEEGLDAAEGYGLHGPVSRVKGAVEYARLTRLVSSIQGHGYDRSLPGGDVTGVVIEKDGDYRFCISHGQHRVAVLAALGHDYIPVAIKKLVTTSELSHWPQVYRGTWTGKEAVQYIDHLFSFDARKWAQTRGLTRQLAPHFDTERHDA